MKSRAPQLHLEYRFYRTLGNSGTYVHNIITNGKLESDFLLFDLTQAIKPKVLLLSEHLA